MLDGKMKTGKDDKASIERKRVITGSAFYSFELSCGHVAFDVVGVPKYCPNCGAKVV